MARQHYKVDAQPAFVLHTRPYRETSLIVDVFSRDHGRVSLLARGARRPRSTLRGLMMAFQPLELNWSGKSEVKTLMHAEWQGGQPLLAGHALFCGFYLNELLLNLLPREDAHPRLYEAYVLALKRFAHGIEEADLRRFEKALLLELGYGLRLEKDAEGSPVDPAAWYAYDVEAGPLRLEHPDNSNLCVQGKTLLDLAADDLADARSLAGAKHLMRSLLSHYLGGNPLATRKIFMELQEL